MELAQSIVHLQVSLLSWQWLILILAVSFHSTLRRLFERIIGLSLGGDRGFSATLSVQDAGTVQGEIGSGKIEKRIDAELFVLRDEHGNERAKLGVTDTGATSLELYDPKGKERLTVFVLADGSSTVALYDDAGIRTMLSRSDTAGVEGLTIFGPDRRNGVHLLVGSEGEPSFDMRDQRGLSV